MKSAGGAKGRQAVHSDRVARVADISGGEKFCWLGNA
jgi:hypothetical protein